MARNKAQVFAVFVFALKRTFFLKLRVKFNQTISTIRFFTSIFIFVMSCLRGERVKSNLLRANQMIDDSLKLGKQCFALNPVPIGEGGGRKKKRKKNSTTPHIL